MPSYPAGIVMVATKNIYAQMAKICIASIRKTDPSPIHITIFSSDESHNRCLAAGPDLVINLENPLFSWGDKIDAIIKSPYEKTIYLDCDIVAIQPFFHHLLDVLKYFPLACNGGMSFNKDWEYLKYPRAISQMNSGVIAFQSSVVQDAFLLWKRYYFDLDAYGDQESLRAALLDSNLRWHNLSYEWNCQPSSLVPYLPYLLHFTGPKSYMLDQCFREKVVRSYIHVFKMLGALSVVSWDYFPRLYYCPKLYKLLPFDLESVPINSCDE